MIEYIKGKIEDLSPDFVVLETNGVGYGLNISLNCYRTLQQQSEAKLYVYEAVREDAYLLYGFYSKAEREIFLLLLEVNGIGAPTARLIISAYPPAELISIVQQEDTAALKAIKGIGPKAAQRIVLELREKVLKVQGAEGNTATGKRQAVSQEVKEAASALQTLGFPPATAQKAALEVVKQKPDATIQEIIRMALKLL